MAKLVRCTLGAIYDVAVDLRAGSPTFGCWHGLELSAENARQLFIPMGFGHGFLALSEWAEVQYKTTAYYDPSAEGAVLWTDPDLGIQWPVQAPILSKKDESAPSVEEYLHEPAFRS
jgi:dTDP-4-dehydrorhamnose 3,5-epimerase